MIGPPRREVKPRMIGAPKEEVIIEEIEESFLDSLNLASFEGLD